jgi:hypothetical protein
MYSANLKKRLDNTRRKRLRCTSESTLRNLSASGRFCDSLVLKSMKRSVINIGRSMLDVRCSMFNLFTVPAMMPEKSNLSDSRD